MHRGTGTYLGGEVPAAAVEVFLTFLGPLKVFYTLLNWHGLATALTALNGGVA